MQILDAVDFGGAYGATAFWSGDNVVIEVRGVEKSLFAPRLLPGEDIGRFSIWSARASNLPQDHVRRIHDQSNNSRTVGFVFSVGALHPDFLQSETYADKYKRLYASIAITAIVEKGVANNFVRMAFDSIEESSPIIDYIDRNCALVVVGRETLERPDRRIGHIKLLLQQYGYFANPRASSQRGLSFSADFQAPIKVSGVSELAADYCNELIDLVAIASKESSMTAKFIGYYQLIEFFLRFEFIKRFRGMLSDTSFDSEINSDPWSIKQAFDEQLSTKKRLVYLIDLCNSKVPSEVQGLIAHGKQFLKAVGAKVPEKDSGGQVLIAVRNHLVHKQGSETDEADQSLEKLVPCLHQLIFELLKTYDFDAPRPRQSGHVNNSVESAIRSVYNIS